MATVSRLLLAIVLACATGCIGDSLVRCGDLSCPVGNVCTPGGCAVSADVTACEGKTEGAACKTFAGAQGACAYGACRTDLCGNNTVDPGEVCDGAVGTDPFLGQTCSPDCKSIYQCGNGVVDPAEQCDDGNQNPADGCDACVRTAWQISTAVGTAVPATSAALATPSGVAIDGQGRVFVADTYNHRIQRIETDGSVTTVAGTGTPEYNGDGVIATSAALSYPNGVAVDGLGRIFIADTANHRIRRVEVDGTITTIAGTGTQGYNGDDQPAILAEVSSPEGVAVDGLGNVFVADSLNHRVRRIAEDGTITTVAGTGNEGYGGDGAPATGADLDTPYGVAVDSQGRVVIADTLNQRIRRVAPSGIITTVAGDGGLGSGGDGGPATSAQLAYPLGLAVDTTDRIYIADTFSQEIRRVDTAGTITRVAGSGVLGFAGDGGSALSAQLQYPQAVAIDGNGQMAIADTANQRVRSVAAGTITTVAGTGMFGFGGDGSEATSAQLSSAFGVGVDTMGRVLIADTFNSRVRRVELDGTITTVAGTGTYGSGGDGGPATSALLANADYVAVDSSGRVVIADTYNHSIRRVELDGTITTVAGTGTSGYNGDGILATNAELANPNGVAVDVQGRILIADTYNQRVRRVELDGTITTVAGTGAFGAGGDGGPGTNAQLGYPYGVAVSSAGIFIADTSNNKVRRIDSGGTITTVAGTGTAGFNGDGIAATTALLNAPYGIAIDASNRIVFSDASNQRIRRIETDGTISTLAGNGTQGGSGDAGAATSAQVAGPLGVAVDKQGRVLIMDTNNQRVRRIESDGTIVTIAGQIDPDNIGPVAKARLEDPQAIAVTPTLTLAAGGTSGTLEAVLAGRVIAVAGQYPQGTATGALARFRTSSFGTVGGTAIDPTTGTIYLSETSSNRLHVVTQVVPSDPKTWTIATLANSAGTAGLADGNAATAQFREPSGLFLAGTTLYIADTGNHAIRALDLNTHVVSTVVNASGALGFGGDGGAAVAALLYQPSAVTRCDNGDLFIADTGNNRVRRVTSTGTITTVLGDGVPASSGEGSPAKTFPVDAPRGLACDSFGNLFVTSSATVRLLPATDSAIVDGNGPVQTIYGGPPRDTFPASVTTCLTGLAVTGATSVQVADACTGLLVQLDRR